MLSHRGDQTVKPSRTDRLNSEYQRAISEIITGQLKNKEPGLKGIISITEADVAPDLKTAKIYVSIFANNAEEKTHSFKILRDNAGFIRRELSRVMTMRTVPSLTFLEDGSMEYGSKMDAIFAELNQNKDRDGE